MQNSKDWVKLFVDRHNVNYLTDDLISQCQDIINWDIVNTRL